MKYKKCGCVTETGRGRPYSLGIWGGLAGPSRASAKLLYALVQVFGSATVVHTLCLTDLPSKIRAF